LRILCLLQLFNFFFFGIACGKKNCREEGGGRKRVCENM
jgi:hypothetical protein